MNEQAYRRRLHSDLAQWAKDGLLTADAAAALRQKYPVEAEASRIPAILSTLGAVLIAAAVAAFVAANWQDMPRTVKLGLIIALVGAGHGLAAWFRLKGREWLFEAASLFGTLSFVAGMALVGQMYHIESDYRGALFVVMLGAGLAAAYGSQGALLIALLALGGWALTFGSETALPLRLLPLVLWAGGCLMAVRHDRDAINDCAAIVLIAVITCLLATRPVQSHDGPDLDALIRLLERPALIITLYGALALGLRAGAVPALVRFSDSFARLAVMAAAAYAVFGLMAMDGREFHVSGWLDGPAVPLALVMLVAAWVARPRETLLIFAGSLLLVALSWYIPALAETPARATWMAWPMAAAMLLGMVGLIHSSLALDRRSWFAWAALGFAAVVMVLLSKTVGTLLGQSVFFVLSGFIVMGLAALARRVLQRKAEQEAQP